MDRVVRTARGGDKAAIAEEGWLREVIAALQAGRAGARRPGARGRARRAAQPPAADRQAGALRRQRRRGRRRGARRRSPSTPPRTAPARSPCPAAWRPSCRELDDEDAAAMRADLGVGESGLDRVVARRVRAAAAELVLHRRQGKIAQSWHLRDGLTRVARRRRDPHRHPEGLRPRRGHRRGTRCIDAGGYAGARDRGTLRARGPRLRHARRRRDHREVHALSAAGPRTPGTPRWKRARRTNTRNSPAEISASPRAPIASVPRASSASSADGKTPTADLTAPEAPDRADPSRDPHDDDQDDGPRRRPPGRRRRSTDHHDERRTSVQATEPSRQDSTSRLRAPRRQTPGTPRRPDAAIALPGHRLQRGTHRAAKPRASSPTGCHPQRDA